MSNVVFHKVATTSDLEEDEAIQVRVGSHEIALINLQGAFFALDDICTHAYASMSDGYIEDGCIECPLHGAMFDIKTGKAVSPPADEDLKSYEVRVENDDILVGIAES